MSSSLIDQTHLYTNQCVQKTVHVPFDKLEKNMKDVFIRHAKKYFVNKCTKEGYITNKPFQVISYSAGETRSGHVEYRVLYEFQTCFPYEGMNVQCKIDCVTKIGIKGILSHDELENPIVVFASHLHNPTIFDTNEDGENNTKQYQEGDIMQIKVVGHRFEVNDPFIYVLGEII